ncbi:periplasmic heavy metal sensor [Meridianimarinicoccus aquatilis]|uniref:Periplasmic heavy metal sensor n=1 Tax=Meridianimarinicoccus aquatilis TaxID=2552766 RepID=A0A4R6AUF8_9RHOB|nr:periplasmic heavy metal sensor [Fluviibacterium aquatile]TDL87830.1 periplasmic heavy metal sensor [Fluviibacterium aquatile]
MAWVKRNLGLKLGLALSLGINLLIVGVVAGVIMNRDDARTGVSGMRDAGLFGYVAMLPRDARDAMRNESRALRAEQGIDWRGEIRTANAALAQEIAKDDLSEESLRAAFQKVSSLRDGADDAVQEALMRQILALPVDQRVKYAERILRGHPKSRKSGDDDRKNDAHHKGGSVDKDRNDKDN